MGRRRRDRFEHDSGLRTLRPSTCINCSGNERIVLRKILKIIQDATTRTNEDPEMKTLRLDEKIGEFVNWELREALCIVDDVQDPEKVKSISVIFIGGFGFQQPGKNTDFF